MSSSPNEKREPAYVCGRVRFTSGTYTAQMQTSKVDSATQLDDNNQSKGNVSYSNISSESNAPVSRSNLNTEEGESSVRRSSRSGKMHVKFNDYVVEITKPETYYEAIKNNNWVEVMNNEIEALNRINTWTLTTLPAGRKAIGCKWLIKIKYKSLGDIDRYNARLVAKGYGQREGIDFDETFNVHNAFLNGDLYEDVYITLPLGFGSNNGNQVCKLNKSLYGLKQASRQWNAKLTTALVEYGFKQSKFDYSSYIKQTDKVFIVLLVYVDDIVITGNNQVEIDAFKIFLSSKYKIKDLGLLKYFLGIEVLKND
ncbi:ribonuclease H-like domain-containing protein [Tanacetum coccineum]